MKLVRVVRGDLMRCAEAVLAHQCNCESKNARGLAKALFERWPSVDVYAKRTNPSTPGTIEVRQVHGRAVVALFGQIKPGKPWGRLDGRVQRLEYFRRALDRLGDFMSREGTAAVAMPYLIGCGLAGGEWIVYEAAIHAFADKFHIQVTLYDLDGKAAHDDAKRPRPGESSDVAIDLT